MGDERLNKIDQIGSDYIPAKFNQITVRAARGYQGFWSFHLDK